MGLASYELSFALLFWQASLSSTAASSTRVVLQRKLWHPVRHSLSSTCFDHLLSISLLPKIPSLSLRVSGILALPDLVNLMPRAGQLGWKAQDHQANKHSLTVWSEIINFTSVQTSVFYNYSGHT